MPKSKSTWTQKLNDSKGYPKVEVIPEDKIHLWGSGTIVIPAPIEVNEFMRQVPQGKLTTINAIRGALAKRHGATIACPLTTGIFSWIAANAAEEQREKGEANITPYWRTLKTGGLLNDKYPGGVDAQKWRLENEGHQVMQKGKKFVVANYEKAVIQF